MKKHEIASALDIKSAEIMHRKGIAVVVTDGVFVQVEKEEIVNE